MGKGLATNAPCVVFFAVGLLAERPMDAMEGLGWHSPSFPPGLGSLLLWGYGPVGRLLCPPDSWAQLGMDSHSGGTEQWLQMATWGIARETALRASVGRDTLPWGAQGSKMGLEVTTLRVR